MNIGIIGSGEVAQSLGAGLCHIGFDVMLGSREPGKKELSQWQKKAGKRASLGTTTETASFAEIAVLAVAWHAAEDVLAQIRPELAGKMVIDVTNPLLVKDSEAPELAVGHDISGGEMVQQSLPDSHVVKTLNIISHTRMVNPGYDQGSPVMPLCGNNPSAKKHVIDLLKDMGWHDIVDLGGIEKSRILEPLALFWIEYGIVRNTWDHAIAILE